MKQARTWTLGLVLLAASTGFAQDRFNSHSSNFRGEGGYTVGNFKDTSISSVSIDLSRGGDARITLKGRSTYEFRGRWTDSYYPTVQVDLDRSPDGRADGRATLLFDRNSHITRIDIRGKSGRESFTAWIAPRKSWGETQRNGNYSARGNGTLTRGRDRRIDLRGATLTLRSNGDFDLRLEGDSRRDISGTWRDASGLSALLTVEKYDGERAEGRGSASFWSGTLERLSVSGKSRRDDFSVKFDGDERSRDSLRGEYEGKISVPDARGQLKRNLYLDRNGSARLVFEFIGGDKPDRFSRKAAEDLGEVIYGLERRRTVTQNGRWTERGDRVTVTLEGKTLEFSIHGKRLTADDYDRRFYGTRGLGLDRQ